jgi:hypothetical protein
VTDAEFLRELQHLVCDGTESCDAALELLKGRRVPAEVRRAFKELAAALDEAMWVVLEAREKAPKPSATDGRAANGRRRAI